MIILAAGMPRTGSTWLYNAIRFIYLNSGKTVYGGGVDTYDPHVKADVHVLKLHDFRDDMLAQSRYVLTTVRDLCDVAASMVRKGWVKDEPEELSEYMRWTVEKQYLPWRDYSILEVPYWQIVKAPQAAVESIMQALGVYSDPCEVAADVEKLARVMRVEMGQDSLMWPGHITDGGIGTYGRTLSEKSIQAMKSLMRELKWKQMPLGGGE